MSSSYQVVTYEAFLPSKVRCESLHINMDARVLERRGDCVHISVYTLVLLLMIFCSTFLCLVIPSLGKRIKAALLVKALPKGDNPAEYVLGSSSSPSRNLVTAIKLASYVLHSGTGGKVSPVDGDGREVGK